MVARSGSVRSVAHHLSSRRGSTDHRAGPSSDGFSADKFRRLNTQGAPSKKRKRGVGLELLHQQLGHRSSHTILLADSLDMWDDTTVGTKSEESCETCAITNIRSKPRGPPKARYVFSYPGQYLSLIHI